MRTGLVVTGVILLVLGVLIGVGGAPMLGLGETVNDSCGGFWGCDDETASAGAMFTSMGIALLFGGGLFALVGIGLLVAGVTAEPKAKPAPVVVPVAGPAMRPCPACEASVTMEAKYCGSCGAAIAPIRPRAAQ